MRHREKSAVTDWETGKKREMPEKTEKRKLQIKNKGRITSLSFKPGLEKKVFQHETKKKEDTDQ